MSTATQEGTFLNRTDDLGFSSEGRIASRFRIESPHEAAEHVIRYDRPVRPVKRSDRKNEPRVLRRLNGFLVEMQGTEARVAFVEDGQTILYDIPAEQLRRSGILTKNQPFQMDEIEMQTEGGLVVGYRFLPLANPSDAYMET